MQQNNVIYNNPSNLDQRLLQIQTLTIPTESQTGFIDTVLPGFPANNIAIANNTAATLNIVNRIIDYIPNDSVLIGPFETRSFPVMTSTEFRIFYDGLVSSDKDTINIFLSNQTIPLFGAKFNPNDEALSVKVTGGEIALLPGDEHIGSVEIDAPLPAGTNHIGSVTAELELTDPLPTGTNHIGSVEIDNTLPIAVTGDVAATIDSTTPVRVLVTNVPPINVRGPVVVTDSLPYGDNLIGKVEVTNPSEYTTYETIDATYGVNTQVVLAGANGMLLKDFIVTQPASVANRDNDRYILRKRSVGGTFTTITSYSAAEPMVYPIDISFLAGESLWVAGSVIDSNVVVRVKQL